VIVKITTGKSFKGAALYFLHDKRQPGENERLTDERVAWTDGFNTVHADPDRVIREMQATALHQQWLRQQSGHTKGGRPTTECVMAISLSWHPEQQPDAVHMCEAARDFLARMGYDQHQALLVAHTDTAHKHVHIILNTIHPETGMTLDRNWSRIRAGQWRVEYERTHGKIYTRAHAADGHEATLHYGEWQAWQDLQKDGRIDPEHTAALKSAEWRTLKQNQRDERLQFWKESAQARRELRRAIRDEVRAEFAPQWKGYTKHRDERKDQARAYDQETRRVLRHYRRHGPLHGVEAVRQIKQRQRAYHQRMRDDLTAQRADINARMKDYAARLLDPALSRLAKDRAEQYQQLLKHHRDEKAGLTHDQAQGIRRPDLLARDPANPNSILSLQQIKAYKEHAITAAARDQQLDQTRRQVTGHNRADPEAERRARTEQSDRARDQQSKADGNEYRRQTDLIRSLAQRRADRESDGRGGGGRER